MLSSCSLEFHPPDRDRTLSVFNMATLDLPSALAAAPPGFTTVEVRVAASGEPSVITTASGVDVPSTEWQLDAVRGLCVAYVANWAIVFLPVLGNAPPVRTRHYASLDLLSRVAESNGRGKSRARAVPATLHSVQVFLPANGCHCFAQCHTLPNQPHLTNPPSRPRLPLYARYADMMLEVAGVDLRAMQSFDDEIRAMPGWVPLGGPRHGGGKMAS